MSQVGEWANEIVIKAAAWFFEIDILVIKEDTNYPIYGSPIGGEGPVWCNFLEDRLPIIKVRSYQQIPALV